MNRTEEVLNLLDEIEQLSIETHQQMFIPDLHRLRAEALRRLDRRHEGIEQQYRLALRLARQRGAFRNALLEKWDPFWTLGADSLSTGFCTTARRNPEISETCEFARGERPFLSEQMSAQCVSALSKPR
jgi:hypothetical protein